MKYQVGTMIEIPRAAITADEIATVTNTSSYNGSGARWFYLNGTGDKKQEKVSESQGDSVYAWLYDYTYGCIDYGCNVAESNIVVGYWTSTRDSETSPNGKYGAWVVNLEGIASGSSVEHNNIFGIRPVITVLKSDID